MGKEVTVSYWYGASLHMALCHGPVDAVTEVLVGDKSAWTGNVTGNATVTIARPDLFGGEEREGGPDGTLDVMMGAQTQAPHAYLQGKFGANIPAFRGVLTALWRGRLCAGNPYIKPWRLRVRRIPAGWYAAKAAIGGDANPAHIIRECLTDAIWGLGWPASDIDDASFTAAADALHAEGFGLSLVWDREMSIQDFIAAVVRHIDGALFVHPRTGKFYLRLIRADYTPAALPVLSHANVLEVDDIARPSTGELVNQIVLTYRDGQTDKDASVTVQNLGLIAAQGGVVSQSVQYPGISSAALAARVAQRELLQHGAALARATITADRTASHLLPGDAFKLTWPEAGFTEVIMRVARIGYGSARDGQVRIDAVQDVFGLPAAVYAAPPASGWANPVSDPAPCPAQLAIETPYWLIVQDVVGDIPSILSDISADEGLVAALGARPSSDAIDFQCMALIGSAWQDRGRGAFAPTGLIGAAIARGAADVTVGLTSPLDFAAIAVGDIALIDEEMLVVTAINAAAYELTLARGALDTVPAPHTAGARCWIVRPHYVQPEYVFGETAQLRMLPKTGRGQLALGGATTISRAIDRRFVRPYPPGRVQVNGQYFPASATGDLSITWARRNRVNQTAPAAPRFMDGDVTPETGATCTVRIYNEQSGGTLIRTEAGLTGTSYTYTTAQALLDNGGTLPANVRLELMAERGGYVSLQTQVVAFAWS